MKVIELVINNTEQAGVDAIALVEVPAIEQDFHAFSKEQFAETYNDYPEAAVNAAKQGIKRNEELGNPCATLVGKQRAQQLVNGEKLSIDTIKRMRSFLIRQKDNYDLAVRRKDYDACGYISYLLWGGEAALPWTEKKLRQAGIEFSLEDACWPDYEAIGTKEKDGKTVPNCVPKEKMSSVGKNVFLISCSALKKSSKMAAKDLYDSPLYKKSLEFSLKKANSPDDVKIISAKYGLVDLNQVIEPYDMTLKDFPAEDQKKWAEQVFRQIDSKFNIQKDRFVFLAGSAYTKYLLPMFKFKSNFLEGKRLGERMQYLNQFSMQFIVLTNNEDYATRHSFSKTNQTEEEFILEQLLMLEFGESRVNLTPNNSESHDLAKNKFAAELSQKKRIITPIMRANFMIPRIDNEGNDYQVFFSPQTIEKIAHKVMTENKQNNINIEHNPEDTIDGVTMVETWLVEDNKKDKSTLYGFSPEVGDWYGIYQMSDEVWSDYIETGKVKGVSAEGYFIEKLIK